MPGEYILTFPGSYHAGFSTGINIGEAVNFVSRSWFDFGFKCQEIYRATREKIPVLPIDWLIIENILNLDYSKGIEPETKVKLRDSFSRIVKEERHHRELLERKLRPVNPEGKQVWEMMENRDNVAEDHYQCKYCTYMSVIICKVHKVHYCISH
jgi:JmjC domain, hydroxylase